jgi:hypothetical protein
MRCVCLLVLMLGCAHQPPHYPRDDDKPWNAPPVPARRVLFQNRYYALPGKADDVLRVRLAACAVLAKFHQPFGRVYRLAGGEGPDVVWDVESDPETAFATRNAKNEPALRAEFDRATAEMPSLLRRFEQSIYSEVAGRGHDVPEAKAK